MSIMRFVWFRKGLKAFDAQVNAALAEEVEVSANGITVMMPKWELVQPVDPKCGWLGLRWLCVAVFKRAAK